MTIGHQLSDNNTAGTSLGQSTTDLVSLYGVTPIAQPTTTSDVVTALINLGLLASGTYAVKGVLTPSTNETGTTGTAGLVASGLSSVNSTIAKTFNLNAPVAGVEKVLYVDATSTGIIKVQLNSTAVNASLVTLRTPAFPGSGSSLGMVVFDLTTAAGGHCVALVGISTTEWMLKSSNINSTVGTSAITYTT